MASWAQRIRSGCQTGRTLIPRAGTAVDLIETTEELLLQLGTLDVNPPVRPISPPCLFRQLGISQDPPQQSLPRRRLQLQSCTR